jgi:hypothetical protein
MTATREMTVANIALLLDRLAADTPPNQQIRELTQNALEAIARRHRTGDATEGNIRWDVDWHHLQRTGQYKLCVFDNGDGMTDDAMAEYLNALAVQGASGTQSIAQNFGVGAKITALFRNRFGLAYHQSWRDGVGSMIKLHRDDKQGVYGLASFDLPDGPHWTPRLSPTAKPKAIAKSGTKVTLLGASPEENTCFPPEEVGGGMNWLVRYLNSRYFRLPENVKLQVRVLTRDEERWPDKEPDPSERTFNLQTIRGLKALLDEKAVHRDTVTLATADAHWWVFDDPVQVSKEMSTRGGRTGVAGIVFQDEVYVYRTPPTARRILAGFGIVFGAEHVALFIEPREGRGLEIRADTARSRLIVNSEDVEEANWWEAWGAEFKEKLPREIKAKVDEIVARAEANPDGRARERILERLQRIRELLRPSRYRRNATGDVMASGSSPGGAPRPAGARQTGVAEGGSRAGGGRAMATLSILSNSTASRRRRSRRSRSSRRSSGCRERTARAVRTKWRISRRSSRAIRQRVVTLNDVTIAIESINGRLE